MSAQHFMAILPIVVEISVLTKVVDGPTDRQTLPSL